MRDNALKIEHQCTACVDCRLITAITQGGGGVLAALNVEKKIDFSMSDLSQNEVLQNCAQDISVTT